MVGRRIMTEITAREITTFLIIVMVYVWCSFEIAPHAWRRKRRNGIKWMF
jgi:hypothetical protein